MKKRKVLSVRNYKAGYQVRREETEWGNIKSAYNLDGVYIGSSLEAYRLCKKRGIKPELMNGIPNSSVCSIGFSERERKWYGWSHRAIFGFKIGDVVKEGDCTNSSGWTPEYLEEHPEKDLSLPVGFTAKSINDTKLMAIAFAESVS